MYGEADVTVPQEGTVTISYWTVGDSLVVAAVDGDDINLTATSGGFEIELETDKKLIIKPQDDVAYKVWRWYTNGVHDTRQRGNKYEFDSNGMDVGERHTVGLFVHKNGFLYNTNIFIVIE